MKQQTKLWMPSRLYTETLVEIMKQVDAGSLTRAEGRRKRKKLDQKRQDFLTMRRLQKRGYVIPVLAQDFATIPPAAVISDSPEALGLQ